MKYQEAGFKPGYYMGKPISLSNIPPNVKMRKPITKYKKGGFVRKTGVAIVHKGEFVLPKGVKPTKAQIKKCHRK